jgi:hypothetical protein
MARCAAAVVCLLVLGVSAPGMAQAEPGAEAPSDDERAHDLYREGDRLYAQGDYEGAIAAFQRSYALSRRPLLLFNLANAFERAGRREQAAEALRQYLPHAPRAEHDSIEMRIEHLRARSQAQAPPEPTPSEPEPPADPQPSAEPPADPQPAPEQEHPPSALRPAGWVLAITAGVALVVGGVAGGVALGARNEASEHCIDGICRQQGQDALERDRTASAVADVAFVSAAALGVTAAVLLLLPAGSHSAEHVRLELGPERIGGSLHGRF